MPDVGTFHANDCEPGMNVYLGLATNAAGAGEQRHGPIGAGSIIWRGHVNNASAPQYGGHRHGQPGGPTTKRRPATTIYGATEVFTVSLRAKPASSLRVKTTHL
jgi:hypothetical protein